MQKSMASKPATNTNTNRPEAKDITITNTTNQPPPVPFDTDRPETAGGLILARLPSRSP